MAKIKPSVQALYINHGEEELRTIIGELHEKLIRLKEKQRADGQLQEWRDLIKEREADIYRPDLRKLEMNLEAARSVAKLRGIRYE